MGAEKAEPHGPGQAGAWGLRSHLTRREMFGLGEIFGNFICSKILGETNKQIKGSLLWGFVDK